MAGFLGLLFLPVYIGHSTELIVWRYTKAYRHITVHLPITLKNGSLTQKSLPFTQLCWHSGNPMQKFANNV